MKVLPGLPEDKKHGGITLEYIRFIGVFFLIHTVVYMIAGNINLLWSNKMYGGREQLYRGYLRNIEEPQQKNYIAKAIWPGQLVRSILMAAVLFPIMGYVGELAFFQRFLFMGSLMFVYADVASAIPFSNTIEGLIYLEPKFVQPKVFWVIQSEAVVYSLLFGLATAAWLF